MALGENDLNVTGVFDAILINPSSRLTLPLDWVKRQRGEPQSSERREHADYSLAFR
jgi:hypothetical protein